MDYEAAQTAAEAKLGFPGCEYLCFIAEHWTASHGQHLPSCYHG
jgi:hypothetical protein